MCDSLLGTELRLLRGVVSWLGRSGKVHFGPVSDNGQAEALCAAPGKPVAAGEAGVASELLRRGGTEVCAYCHQRVLALLQELARETRSGESDTGSNADSGTAPAEFASLSVQRSSPALSEPWVVTLRAFGLRSPGPAFTAEVAFQVGASEVDIPVSRQSDAYRAFCGRGLLHVTIKDGDRCLFTGMGSYDSCKRRVHLETGGPPPVGAFAPKDIGTLAAGEEVALLIVEWGTIAKGDGQRHADRSFDDLARKSSAYASLNGLTAAVCCVESDEPDVFLDELRAAITKAKPVVVYIGSHGTGTGMKANGREAYFHKLGSAISASTAGRCGTKLVFGSCYVFSEDGKNRSSSPEQSFVAGCMPDTVDCIVACDMEIARDDAVDALIATVAGLLSSYRDIPALQGYVQDELRKHKPDVFQVITRDEEGCWRAP